MHEQQSSSYWPWIIGAILIAFVAEGVALTMMRRSRLPATPGSGSAVTPAPGSAAGSGSAIAPGSGAGSEHAEADAEMARWIEGVRGRVAAALKREQVATAKAELVAFRDRLPGHPGRAEGDAVVSELADRIREAGKRAEQRGPPWHVPKVLGTNEVGSWNLQPGSLIGRCPSGPKIAIIRLGWPKWKNYEVRFEIELAQGDLGFYMRGMVRTAQFPSFLTRVGVKQGTGEWFKVHATARGTAIELRITPLDGGEAKVLQQTNRESSNGIFGFVLHSAGEVNIRQLEARELK